MPIYTIYRATNITNNKCYVGFDSAWPNRKRDHLHNPGREYFHRAIRKYGKKAFIWEVLYQSQDPTHTHKEMEAHFIRENNAYCHWENGGYNMTLGGEGVCGVLVSEETRNKLRKAHVGRKQTPEWIEKRRQKKLGVKRSEKSKQKMRNAQLGKTKPLWVRERMSEAQRKRWAISRNVGL